MTLEPVRWERLDTLFHGALELPPDERATFLDRECGDDPQLRRQLDRLLDVEGRPMPQAMESVQRSRDRLVGAATPTLVGRRIGAYRLDREIGRGGMGVVYLGVREEGDFTQQVAIKVLPAALLSGEARWRFQNERQILADVDHPRIARLLDGGETEDGLPYVIMELVDGLPIDDFCDAHALGIRERLALFLQVCEAVSYAHAHLVVHRDIKPTNILVSRDGSPRLLDFGIAKLLSAEPGEHVTRRGIRVLTPSYASPEQIRGDRVGTASDQYSMGVLLYKLLAGALPFDLADKTPAEAELIVADGDPTAPSKASGIRALEGDLDTVVLKALRSDPADRYASVELLAADLRRYLDGRPVSARAPTFRYRAGKFVRRNKGGVLGASLVLVLVVGFVATTLLQSRRVARERDAAEAERARATAVVDFLTDVFGANDPNESKGTEMTAGEILSRGGQRAREELADQPAVKGEILQTIGSLYMKLGAFDSAAVYLEDARAVRKAALGVDDPDYARSLDQLGRLAEARGDKERARQLFTQVVEKREKIYGPDSEWVAAALYELGRFEVEQGEDGARPLLERVVRIRESKPDPDEAELLKALDALSIILRREGSTDSAAVVVRRGLAIKRRMYGEENLSVAASLNLLGAIDYTRGRLKDAEKEFREVVAIRKHLTSPTHPLVLTATNNLAIALADQGRYEEAEGLLRSVIQARKERGDGPSTYASPLNNLGIALVHLDRPREAAEAFRESIAARREALGERHPSVAFPLMGLGRALEMLGDLEGAEAALQEALRIRIDAYGPDHRLVAVNQYTLGRFYINQGRLEEAEASLTEALRIQREVLDPGDVHLAETLAALGKVELQRGERAGGLAMLREAIPILRNAQSPRVDPAELEKLVEADSAPRR